MMIDPSQYAKAMSKLSLDELIEEKAFLIKEIEDYEKGNFEDDYICCHPSPEVIYKCNLKYLDEISKLIKNR